MTPEKQQRLQACLQEVAHILYLEKPTSELQENPQVAMPVFANHLEVPRIAGEICDRFKATTHKSFLSIF